MEQGLGGIIMDQLRLFLQQARQELLLIGISLILFGLLALFVPGITLTLFAQIIAGLVTLWGIVNIIGSVRRRTHDLWLLGVVTGGLICLIGILGISFPFIIVGTLSALIGVIILLWGLTNIAFSKIFPTGSRGRIRWLASGMISVGVALTLLFFPIGSAQVVVWIIGGYSLVMGISLIGNAWDISKIDQQLNEARTIKKSHDVIDIDE